MESKYNIIPYTPDVVEAIRRDINLDTEEKRTEAFKIIEDWLLKQDHLVQKTFSRGYIERCLVTNKGSVERTKIQIDRICTFRTLLPQYFQLTNLKGTEVMKSVQKCHIGISSKLTKEHYRVMILRIKPNVDVKSTDWQNFDKFLAYTGQFLKANDYCKGFIFVGDTLNGNTAEIFSKLNLLDLQQYLPILTEGLGCKIKGVVFLTASKFIESFIKMFKPLFKEKIRNRIHVATSKEHLLEIIPKDMLPADYGGTEKSLEELNDDLFETLCSESVEKLMIEMNAACTDESKRRRDKFNDQYMGMPGSFRNLHVD